MKKVPIALTIAGSDSGGGAGIQADLKTFACLGVHGASAITSITAQNTLGVQGTYDLPPRIIRDQIDAILEDMRVGCAKTGMLSSSEIIHTVASALKKYDFPLVVDPIMQAESGGKLLREEAIPTMIQELFPLGTVVTPNIFEAERLTGIKIKSREDARKAALMLNSLGAKKVIVTGGHLDYTDVLYDGKIMFIEGERVEGGTHGAGCTYSAAITAELSKGKSLREAAAIAKRFVEQAISRSFEVGEGCGPVNQMASLAQDAERYLALKNVEEGLALLEESETFSKLIPEVGCNLGMAIPGAKSIEDVVAVSGRIIPLKGRAHPVSCVTFGASSHVARIILGAMSYDGERRGAINIKYSKEILSICKDLGLEIASFSRLEEPENTSTLDWGIRNAIEKIGKVPDVVYDLGAQGKEPMIRLLASSASEVAERAIRISERVAHVNYR